MSRAREIIQLAATKTKVGRFLLQNDDSWEARAEELLDSTADTAVEQGLSVERVNEEIALEIALEVVSSIKNYRAN